MNILLDACAFLWVTLEPNRLSVKARRAFADPDNGVFLSAVSSWEIALRYGLGQLELPRQPAQFLPDARKEHGITFLPLDEAAVLLLPALPSHHKDPFDRMLVCQAMAGDFVIMTPDRVIAQYSARILW